MGWLYPDGMSGSELDGASEDWYADDECDAHRCTEDENGNEIEVPCTFKGEVYKELVGKQVYWTCPECGHEHEYQYNPY